MTDSFHRYLRAKRSVDDRAIDRRLNDDLRDRLAGTDDLRVLEVGAGIGTMVARFVEWDVFPPGTVRYTAVDLRPDTVASLRRYLREWADGRSVSITGAETLTVTAADRRIEVEPVAAEAAAYAEDATTDYDLLVGAALLDVFDRSRLDALLGALSPGGLYYFPITFDGATRFRPSHPADRRIERRYHDHMDAKPGGSSRAGGEVLDRLRRRDGTLDGVAGSDWIVRPIDGEYPGDEAYFLRFIVDTVEEAVRDAPGSTPSDLGDWLARRRSQIDAGELCYLTHQLDFLGRVEAPGD